MPESKYQPDDYFPEEIPPQKQPGDESKSPDSAPQQPAPTPEDPPAWDDFTDAVPPDGTGNRPSYLKRFTSPEEPPAWNDFTEAMTPDQPEDESAYPDLLEESPQPGAEPTNPDYYDAYFTGRIQTEDIGRAHV